MIRIDGSFGEGGGQILRTSLALSMLTQQPFRITNIRANRKKPGLKRQHLTAVQAAAEICGASVSGAVLQSTELMFSPRHIRTGNYHFDIGSAGSTGLVLQTVLLPLVQAGDSSSLIIDGGTHNMHAPPFDFLERAFLPLVNRMGANVQIELKRPGFYPAGGGRVRVRIKPGKPLAPLLLRERGPIRHRLAIAIVAGLPVDIAHRELRTVRHALNFRKSELTIREIGTAPSPGNVLLIEIASQNVTEVFTGFGRIGVRAEQVAREVIDEVRPYLEANMAVGPYLADQLLLPLALAGGSAFTTVAPTRHTRTNIAVIEKFLDVAFAVEETAPGCYLIAVK